MKHLKSVTVVNDKRSHWVANALGASVEWDADIIEDRENISWLQLKEQTRQLWFWWFKPAPGDRGTEVKVVIEYAPPGGVVASRSLNSLAKTTANW